MLFTTMLQQSANQQTGQQQIGTESVFNRCTLTASHTAYWRSLCLEKPVVNRRFCLPRNTTLDAFEPWWPSPCCKHIQLFASMEVRNNDSWLNKHHMITYNKRTTLNDWFVYISQLPSRGYKGSVWTWKSTMTSVWVRLQQQSWQKIG